MSEWTRVQDVLPKEGQIVVAWMHNANEYVLVRFGIDKHGPIWRELHDVDIDDPREPDLISHWMPLPEPPKDK